MKIENIDFPGEQSRRFDPCDPNIHSHKLYTVFWRKMEHIYLQEGDPDTPVFLYDKEPTGHVVYAANVYNGHVYYIKHFEGDAPSRHPFIRDAVVEMFRDEWLDKTLEMKRFVRHWEMGFILSDGQFVSREKAAIQAKKYGQVLPSELDRVGRELVSENLW